MNDEIKKYLTEAKFGLGVVDLSTKNGYGDVDIIHAAFYVEKPTQNDKNSLLKEVLEDESFGLSKVTNTLTVIDLPDSVFAKMLKDVQNKELKIADNDNQK